jgi:N-formylmaleamate deformylase
MVTASSDDFVSGASSWLAGTVEISGGYLAYHRTSGSGPALVLSHGLTDNGLCWSRVATALAAGFDIVMLDARGHGESSRMLAGEMHDPGRDIAEAIARLGLKSPIVMGHSVGARATAAYASANPGGALKVILEDPPFLPIADRSEAAVRKAKFRHQVAKFQALSVAEITAMGKNLSPDWHDDEFPAWTLGKRQVDPEAMPDYAIPWQELLTGIAAPTLLIYGESERGGLVSREIAAEATRINPNIRAVQIRGAGHNIRRENFHGFIAAVKEFLSEDQVTLAIEGTTHGGS